MSRPSWMPRAEPRVKQPKKPYRWHGWRVKNQCSGNTGRIVETLWDGWHWKLTVLWDQHEHVFNEDTASFFLYNDIIDEEGKLVQR